MPKNGTTIAKSYHNFFNLAIKGEAKKQSVWKAFKISIVFMEKCLRKEANRNNKKGWETYRVYLVQNVCHLGEKMRFADFFLLLYLSLYNVTRSNQCMEYRFSSFGLVENIP